MVDSILQVLLHEIISTELFYSVNPDAPLYFSANTFQKRKKEKKTLYLWSKTKEQLLELRKPEIAWHGLNHGLCDPVSV